MIGEPHTVTANSRAKLAMASFHLGVARAGHADDGIRDDHTLPLIPLVLILDADGTLAVDARRVLAAP